jgi:hypothetical protein
VGEYFLLCYFWCHMTILLYVRCWSEVSRKTEGKSRGPRPTLIGLYSVVGATFRLYFLCWLLKHLLHYGRYIVQVDVSKSLAEASSLWLGLYREQYKPKISISNWQSAPGTKLAWADSHIVLRWLLRMMANSIRPEQHVCVNLMISCMIELYRFLSTYGCNIKQCRNNRGLLDVCWWLCGGL